MLANTLISQSSTWLKDNNIYDLTQQVLDLSQEILILEDRIATLEGHPFVCNILTSISLFRNTFRLDAGLSFKVDGRWYNTDDGNQFSFYVGTVPLTVTWTSSNEAVASVEDGKGPYPICGVITAKANGTATITAKCRDKTATCVVTVKDTPQNGVLIGGIVWAKSNVDDFGTFASSPESVGKFYQWNRPTAWASTGTVTGWDSSMPTGTTWEKVNDPSPAGWRVPNKEEISILTDRYSLYVMYEWTTLNGVNGGRFTDMSSGNSIFLPVTSVRQEDGQLNPYYLDEGDYWSSNEIEGGAITMLVWSSGSSLHGWSKNYGLAIRSVAE
jgi:hypothetical protein